ncbi:MAG: PA domain-containing protein [Acidobacteriota bacterium]
MPKSKFFLGFVLVFLSACLLTTGYPAGSRPASEANSADGSPTVSPEGTTVGCPLNQVRVLFPGAIAGDYEAGGAVFGPVLDETGVTGDVVLADDGTGTATDGCEPLINGGAISGNIALIDRGDCNFTVKVENAEAVGATAVIVANNAGDELITMGCDPADCDCCGISSVFIGQTDGQTIRQPPRVIATTFRTFSSSGDPTLLCSRPSPMGVSTSTTPTAPLLIAGTAGMRVRSLSNPATKFILSNNHVLGAAAPTLCPDTAPPGTRALQPATGDLGFDPGPDPTYVVGATVATIPIDFSAGASNLVDAAIAFTTEQLASTQILGIGDPTPALLLPSPGAAVTKAGRTTRVTTGTIASVGGTFNVNYGASCGMARFVNQVSVTPGSFSDSGDSGSTILDAATLAPVAHLFAGSASSTIGNPMILVYLLLRVFVDSPAATGMASEQEIMDQIQALEYPPEIQSLMAIQAREEKRIFRNPGVEGMAIGLDNGKGHYAFVIYVEKLTPALARLLPGHLDGVPVRVEESGKFYAFPGYSPPVG